RECDAGLPGRGLRTDLGLLGMRPGVDRARENLTTRKTETVPSLRYLDGRLETYRAHDARGNHRHVGGPDECRGDLAQRPARHRAHDELDIEGARIDQPCRRGDVYAVVHEPSGS